MTPESVLLLFLFVLVLALPLAPALALVLVGDGRGNALDRGDERGDRRNQLLLVAGRDAARVDGTNCLGLESLGFGARAAAVASVEPLRQRVASRRESVRRLRRQAWRGGGLAAAAARGGSGEQKQEKSATPQRLRPPFAVAACAAIASPITSPSLVSRFVNSAM